MRTYEVLNFDPVKYLEETVSRVGYACEIIFDPLVSRHTVYTNTPHENDTTTCSESGLS